MGAHSAQHDPTNCGDAYLCDCPCGHQALGNCPAVHCKRIGWGCHYFCTRPGVRS